MVAIAAIAVAEAAVWLLRPRGDITDPASVAAADFFDPAALARIADFHDPQRLLGLGSLALEFLVLVVLALWRPAPIRRLLRFPLGRPILGAAAVAAAISLTLAMTSLPIGLVAHERAVDVGLSTRDFWPWLEDRALSAGVAAILAAAGGIVAVLLIRRLGKRFWVAGSAIVVGYAIVFTWLTPVVLAPVFNDFESLPDGPVRSQVLDLSRKAGVDVGEVYVVDASRRSTALNAYVDGVGSSKRVVIYDNTIEQLDRDELGSLIAHELGHVAADDIWRGIAFVAIVTPLGMLFVQMLAFGLTERRGGVPGTPAVLPALALAIAAVTLALNVPGNQLSRMVEAGADTYAMELTGDPGALIGLQRRFTTINFGDPDSPDLLRFLFATHPSALERIGAAVTFREEQRPGGG